jgi:hypothetical protein
MKINTLIRNEDVMLPRTVLEPQDDPAFLAVVDRILATLVCQDRPDDLYLVHIDNWFDRKWLRYSGYGVIAFPQGYPWILVAKEEHRQKQLTFPPFTPNRVVSQYLFCRVANVGYEEQVPAQLIHRRDRQRSAKNLHRRVTNFSRSGLFVWYSSGSVANGRGSLLVYSVKQDAVAAWYAGFSDRGGWRLDQAEGIGRDVVVSLMAETLPVELT